MAERERIRKEKKLNLERIKQEKLEKEMASLTDCHEKLRLNDYSIPGTSERTRTRTKGTGAGEKNGAERTKANGKRNG
jgi:hypothetical protein